MAFEFRLPDIGEGVVEGEIVRWLVQPGEVVREDQPLVEVMTDKATVEIPSPKAGRVVRLGAAEGKSCAVGQVLIVIDPEAAAAPAPVVEVPREATQKIVYSAPPAPPLPVAPPPTATAASAVAAEGKILATPATRQLARDLGVAIDRIAGTGDRGRVTTEDVRAHAAQGRATSAGPTPPRAAPAIPAPPVAAPLPAPAAPVLPTVAPVAVGSEAGDERVPFRGVRKKIAENMARSKRTAAHFTYVEECDVTELVAVRNRARQRAEERGVKLSFLPFVVKAVVAGLKKYPIVNAALDEERGEIVLRKRYHIGVAAASEQGLIVPVLRDADKKSLFELGRELQELSEKAKTGKASRDELTGSTFTISSLGALGGVLATPIINHPEVAVLGLHKIKSTPVVRDGQIVIREMMNLSISLDHRVVDGYEGAMFLNHVIELLADPTALFMELV